MSDADRGVLLAEAAAKEREKLAAKAKEAEERAAAKVREAEAKKQALADAAKRRQTATHGTRKTRRQGGRATGHACAHARASRLPTRSSSSRRTSLSLTTRSNLTRRMATTSLCNRDAKRRKTAAGASKITSLSTATTWELKEETRKHNAQAAKKKKEEAAKAKILAECAEDGTKNRQAQAPCWVAQAAQPGVQGHQGQGQ